MAKNVKKISTPSLNQRLTAALLGKAIKARRTQSNLRLEDAAALCGVAKDTLMKIEHGRPSCRLDSILRVCDGLGVQLSIQPWQENNEVSDEWQ